MREEKQGPKGYVSHNEGPKEHLIKSSSRRRGSSNYLNILDSRLRGNDKTIPIQSVPNGYISFNERCPLRCGRKTKHK